MTTNTKTSRKTELLPLVKCLNTLDRRNLQQVVHEGEGGENLAEAVHVESESKVQHHTPEDAPVPVPRHVQRAHQRWVEHAQQLHIRRCNPLPGE